jgi:hypothetical protein
VCFAISQVCNLFNRHSVIAACTHPAKRELQAASSHRPNTLPQIAHRSCAVNAALQMALYSTCPTSSQPQTRPSGAQHRRQATIHAAQQPRQMAGRPAAARTKSGAGAPAAASLPLSTQAALPSILLLSAVQLLASLQLVLAPPAAADGGDFTIRSEAAAEDAEDQYFETVPQGLNSADSSTAPRLGALIEGPKGKQVQQCVRKCVPTCVRGGQGSPGVGPMTFRCAHACVTHK